MFLVTRYRRFLRLYLMILADRLQTDHVKVGPFEIRGHDAVISLDPKRAWVSTRDYDSEDINRIERMFEFIADDRGFKLLHVWVAREIGTDVDFDDFLTAPQYATQRLRAFDEVEGLAG